MLRASGGPQPDMFPGRMAGHAGTRGAQEAADISRLKYKGPPRTCDTHTRWDEKRRNVTAVSAEPGTAPVTVSGEQA